MTWHQQELCKVLQGGVWTQFCAWISDRGTWMKDQKMFLMCGSGEVTGSSNAKLVPSSLEGVQ